MPDQGSKRRWRLCVDVGGTFTDVVALSPDGAERTLKVLSTAELRVRGRADDSAWLDLDGLPGSLAGSMLPLLGMNARPAEGDRAAPWPVVAQVDEERRRVRLSALIAGLPTGVGADLIFWTDEEPPVLALRLLTRSPVGDDLPACEMRLATTRATNALLTGSCSPVVLVTNRGLADVPIIGTQQRPDLFARDIVRPPPLHAETIEIQGRLDAHGAIIEPHVLGESVESARAAAARGLSAAVSLLHSDLAPQEENLLAGSLRALGFETVACSAELSQSMGFLARTQTAIAEAALAPVIRTMVNRLRFAAGEPELSLMTSAAGLGGADQCRAKDLLLSGPAAGVLGAIHAAQRMGFSRIITFDMGGTSTDVCRINGRIPWCDEHSVGACTIRSQAAAVRTVAAGGGSICSVVGGSKGSGFRDGEGGMLRVGPHSAGADPGPACYGRGGPLTLTDVNLLLGRIDPSGFEFSLDLGAAAARLGEVLLEYGLEDTESSRHQTLETLLDLAIETMAGAVRAVSAEEGFEPSDHALLAFGGAGPQHACAIADRLGIPVVLIPRNAGLLSATGLVHAQPERIVTHQVMKRLSEIDRAFLADSISAICHAAISAIDVADGPCEVCRLDAALRLIGQASTLDVDILAEWNASSGIAPTLLRDHFRRVFRDVRGYEPPDRETELVRLRAAAQRTPGPAPERQPQFSDEPERVRGPARIANRHCSIEVDAGWVAESSLRGVVIRKTHSTPTRPPMTPEVFAARLGSIATEAGEHLRRTAVSTNIRDRLDYSCAVLSADGELIANAPHVPVHLGSLGECTRRIIEVMNLDAGDIAITNHPAFGGSHLPDVTLIAPVHAARSWGPGGAGGVGGVGTLLGFVAARAHHAEIGGSRPGSMPPDARSLAHEGIIIPPMHWVRGGVVQTDAIRFLLTSSRYPSRAVEDNLADIAAAAAGLSRARAALQDLADHIGVFEFQSCIERVLAKSCDAMTACLRRLPASRRSVTEHLDDGTPLCATLHIDHSCDRPLVIDFSGSGGPHPGNLNATTAIVRSAVLYVLRVLVAEDLPLNEGLLRPVRIIIPDNSILSPCFSGNGDECPAVVGGNTETSQRLVDALIRALGISACSQGTMNNVVFGNETFSYYETICGGAGATATAPGASGVHTHMTNTRITDPEVLERRCPVRLEKFALRRGSGGSGAWRGGDGVIREIRFLDHALLSVVTQHRRSGPFGDAGGESGAPGSQCIIRAAGDKHVLSSVDGASVNAGDVFIIETPGGGGYGPMTGASSTP